MAKLRMAHASTHGARKPPGPKLTTASNYSAECLDDAGIPPFKNGMECATLPPQANKEIISTECVRLPSTSIATEPFPPQDNSTEDGTNWKRISPVKDIPPTTQKRDTGMDCTTLSPGTLCPILYRCQMET